MDNTAAHIDSALHMSDATLESGERRAAAALSYRLRALDAGLAMRYICPSLSRNQQEGLQ